MRRLLISLVPLLLAACTVRVGEDTPAYKWQSGDYRGYCRMALAAVGAKDRPKLASILRYAGDQTLATQEKIDAAASSFISLADIGSQGMGLQREIEIPAPYGRSSVALAEAWKNEKGTPLYLGCLVLTTSAVTRRVVLKVNSDANALRQSMLDEINGIAAPQDRPQNGLSI